ncbi:hypothetical protein EJB05_57554, partial [Eragrostis curvula]
MFQNGESWKTRLEMITSVEYISSSRCGLVKGSVRFFHMSHHTLPWPSMVPFSPAQCDTEAQNRNNPYSITRTCDEDILEATTMDQAHVSSSRQLAPSPVGRQRVDQRPVGRVLLHERAKLHSMSPGDRHEQNRTEVENSAEACV